MFECSKSNFGKHKRYHIHHPKLKTGFSLVPSKGATLLDLTFSGEQVLDGYTQPEELESMDWMKNTLLYPFPNRLDSGRYAWMNRSHQFAINDQTTQNALHGFAAFQKFEVTRILLTEAAAEITCRLEENGKIPGYPFPTTLEVTYGISSNNKFRVEFSILNRYSEHIPVGLGWHPYFALTPNVAQTALRMPECERVETNARMIPSGIKTDYNSYRTPIALGETFLDTCFKVKTSNYLYRASIQGDGKKITFGVNGKSWPFLQVFTPPKRHAIAIEPMTCNIDAFNNHDHLIKLPPGGIWKGGFYLEYTNK